MAILGALVAVVIAFAIDLLQPSLTTQWFSLTSYLRSALAGLIIGGLAGASFRSRTYEEEPIRQVTHMGGV